MERKESFLKQNVEPDASFDKAGFAEPSLDEVIFAEAIERVEAGESADLVIASYAPQHQAELRDMLAIVVATAVLRHAPVPRPATSRRSAQRAAFLQKAAELRTAVALEPPVAPRPAIATTAQPGSLATSWQQLQQQITAQIAATVQQLAQGLVGRPGLRLAPFIALLAIVISSFGLVQVAQAAMPGNLTYPVKQWIRKQELNLASPAQRVEVVRKQEAEQAQEIVQAAQVATKQSTAIRASGEFIFYGYADQLAADGRTPLLKIGNLLVQAAYQPNVGQPTLLSMPVPAGLVPGTQVRLAYQIVPDGVSGTQTPIVQGIALQMIEEQPLVPTPIPTATPTQIEQPSLPSNCTVSNPGGWLPYRIQPGDTLAALAARTGTNIATLRIANCLPSDSILADTLLLVPTGGDLGVPAATATGIDPPTGTPTVLATSAAVSGTVVAGTVTPTATPVEATPTISLTTTPVITPGSTGGTVTPITTPGASNTITATISAVTATPVPSPTAAATPVPPITATLVISNQVTPVATLTATPSETPIATVSATETLSDTVDPASLTATPLPTATSRPGAATSEATPTLLPTFTATLPATPEPTPTVAATATEIPTEAATEVPTTLPALPPTDTPITPPLPTEIPTAEGATPTSG